MPTYKCANCGQTDNFRAEIVCIGTLLGDGELLLDNPGDPELDNGAYTYCPQCDHEDILENFLVKEDA